MSELIFLQKYNEYLVDSLNLDKKILKQSLEKFVLSFLQKEYKTGYQLFCSEVRPLIKSENPNLSSKEITKELTSMWSSLNKDEKNEWNIKVKGESKEKLDLIKKVLTNDGIKKILNQVHPDTQIQKESLNHLIEIFKPVFEVALKFLNKQDVKGFLNKIPGTLKTHSEKVSSFNNKNQAVFETSFKSNFVNITEETSIKFALIFEYLFAEVLELGGNYCRDNGRIRIKSEDIDRAIYDDEELKELFYDKN
jgi:hypothetical protein